MQLNLSSLKSKEPVLSEHKSKIQRFSLLLYMLERKCTTNNNSR